MFLFLRHNVFLRIGTRSSHCCRSGTLISSRGRRRRRCVGNDFARIKPAFPVTVPGISNLQAIQDTLRLDTVKIEWHPDVGEIDLMGLEHEFRESGPLLPQSEDVEDKQPDDLEWHINPKLTRYQRRLWTMMLRKYLKSFAGPKGQNLGKLSSKFDFDIDADISLVRPAQPYRASPKKRGLIRDAVKKLSDLNVIQPSSSPIASPVVVVIQKGKSRFCVDLREVNSKTTSDRYALPRQDTIFRSIGRAIFFSTWDCNKGYHQFGLTSRARLLTVFRHRTWILEIHSHAVWRQKCSDSLSTGPWTPFSDNIGGISLLRTSTTSWYSHRPSTSISNTALCTGGSGKDWPHSRREEMSFLLR